MIYSFCPPTTAVEPHSPSIDYRGWESQKIPLHGEFSLNISLAVPDLEAYDLCIELKRQEA